jgi:hypothetical protein
MAKPVRIRLQHAHIPNGLILRRWSSSAGQAGQSIAIYLLQVGADTSVLANQLPPGGAW